MNIASKDIAINAASAASAAIVPTRIRAALVEMFGDLSGVDLSDDGWRNDVSGIGVRFLFLTQAARPCRKNSA